MTIVSDAFSGSGALSASWSGFLAGAPTDFTQSGGGAHATADGADHLIYWNANTFPGDQYAKITISTLLPSNWNPGPAVRINSDASSGYRAIFKSNNIVVQKVGGTDLLNISAGISIASGDVIELRSKSGGVVEIWQNGALIGSGTDAAPLTDIYVGFGGYAVQIASIINNFEGGDYVAAADTTAPTLTSATGAGTAPTTASGSVTTDEANGTLSAVVTTSATKPSVAQVKAGQNDAGTAAAYATSKTVTATGAQAFAATGLTASTTYYWHFQQVDAAANDSTVVSSASFATPAPNAAPTFSGTIADISGTQGTALTGVDVASYFSDTDALTYSKVGTWPAGVTLTGSVIGGTPTVSGTFASLKVRATDTASQTVDSNAFTITLAAVAATAITMTGPTSGAVGAASSNFTVGANGTITGTVVVTPSDGGGGGTFTPTTVSISSGSPTGTFTYTPASTGAKTISATNNGSLTAPSNITFTASATSGTVTTPALKNNTATTQASLTGLVVHVLKASDGTLVVSKTGQTTDAGGVLAVNDAAITAGTAYLLAIVNPTTGAVGITNSITAA